ncbi:MAG: DUF4399 domain-containing protein, partial [Myxococcota bacterium]|nr:DUF4399 domain-containing protein [Myxococcota bacterium]
MLRLSLMLLSMFTTPALAQDDDGPAFSAALEGATVSFVAPQAGSEVTSPVAVQMGIEGMTIQPAGTAEVGSGHHHIIVDGEGVALGQVVPADATHIHYGGGQTETELELEPGEHTLTLQLADGLHRSYGPALSTSITVTVIEGEAAAPPEAEVTGGDEAAAEPAPEQAEEPAEPEGLAAAVDAFFGTWIVGPLAAVLFWAIPGLD